MAAARSALACAGRAANDAVSFVVFMVLDVLEVLLCVVYKVADYLVEGAWRPCYCSRSSSGKIVVSERGGSKVVSMLSATRLHLEDISDTLYTRPSVLASAPAPQAGVSRAAVVHMLRGKIGVVDDGKHRPYPSPRWSDCHCANCNPADTDRLFVHVEAPPGTTKILLLHTHPSIHVSFSPRALLLLLHRRRCDGGRRAVHPRLHLVLRVLDGDGAPEREPRGPVAAAALRRGPARVRAQPEAGGLAVHAAGARGDDRALRHPAPRRQVLPHRRALAGLHPRARARRQVPSRRQVNHPRRAGNEVQLLLSDDFNLLILR
jgi:hypothetical protein